MKRKKKKTFKLIIILIFVLMFIVFISKFFKMQTMDLVDDYDNIKYVNLNENETLKNDIMIPENSIDFFKNYFGKIDSKNIYEAIDNFSREILPKYINGLKDITKLEYYNFNINSIKEELGIENIEQFEKFAEKLENINETNFVLENIRFDKEKVYTESNGTSAVLIIEYAEDINIEINIYVPNEENTQNENFIIFN